MMRTIALWCGAALILVGAACSGTDAPPTPPAPSWSLALRDLDPAILAIAPLDGTGDDLLAVGGPLVGDDPPALYRRKAGQAFEAVTAPPGWTGAIWWAWASSPDNVWVVGNRAQIAHGKIDALEKLETGTSTEATFYGVWGSAPNDVWIVGGAPRATEGPRGFVLHYDGQQIAPVTLTGTASTATAMTLFKVWGAAADDVMIVGAGGTAIHFDGGQWDRTDTPTTDQLTTVHGRGPNEFYAVGGLNQGTVLRWDGATWTSIGEPFAPTLSGVFAAPDGRVWVAGDSGYLAVFDGANWENVDTSMFTQFHAVFATATETLGVGGVLSLSSGPRNGFVGRYGP